MINWLDPLGDWNPQLMREIKGRLKPRNLLIASVISLVGQFLLFLLAQNKLPIAINKGLDGIQNKYCTGTSKYGDPKCLQDALGNFVINWQVWWLELFLWLSMIGVFALLVAGTYLLISDLAHEERRGTLNFIRLSPQSPENILVGKLLGVPILLYLVAVLAVPLHLWAGLAAQISLIRILSFYTVLLAGCFFFYSAALLFGLVSTWLGGFQAWLGSGVVLILLANASLRPIEGFLGDLLKLFSPSLILQYLIVSTGLNPVFSFSYLRVQDLQWFSLPLGVGTLSVASSLLLNYGLWTYWSWQALKRRFPNPGKAVLSKRQSYLLVACFEVVLLGFAVAPKQESDELLLNFQILLVINLLLFLSLIVALTPGRQTLQDWARYRRQQAFSRNLWSRLLMSDLVWGEKSPALVAIAINLAITSAILVSWIVFSQNSHQLQAFLSLVIICNLTLVYAAITQLIMLMRTQKQALWVISTLGAVIGLPTVIVTFLSASPSKIPGLWLVTPFAGAAIEYASTTTVFLALLGQWSILTLFTFQITRQLKANTVQLSAKVR
jgi:hypothetical protein